MFKNATIYGLGNAAELVRTNLSEQLGSLPFAPCGPTERISWGFVAPSLKPGAALAETLGGGRVVVAVRRQERKVPGQAIKQRVSELSAQVEQETGRKPGAKRRRELKEEALLELLPKAFTKDTTALVMVDTEGGRLVLNSTSTGMLDGVLTALTKAIPGFAPEAWSTMDSPGSWMAKALSADEQDGVLEVGRELELCSNDMTKRRVRWKNSDLLGKDVQENLESGASVVRMGVEFQGRTSFVLTESGQIKGLSIDVAAMKEPDGKEADDAWRADAELWTGELALLVAELERQLGGRVKLGAEYGEQHAESGGDRNEAAAVAQPAGDGPDPLYEQAVTLVMAAQRASISLVQRHLRIGYNRTARLLERMETEGLVSSMNEQGVRSVMRAAA